MCQAPPPTELPGTFIDVSYDTQLEVKRRNMPCIVTLSSTGISLNRSGAKPSTYTYDTVVDILMDEGGEMFTIGASASFVLLSFVLLSFFLSFQLLAP